MKRSNLGAHRRKRLRVTGPWLVVIALLSVTACANPGGVREMEPPRPRPGKIVEVGPLAELHPTRPDRCARPRPEFEQQLGYVVIYRSAVGVRTRVVALEKAMLVKVGDAVSVAEGVCNGVALANTESKQD